MERENKKWKEGLKKKKTEKEMKKGNNEKDVKWKHEKSIEIFFFKKLTQWKNEEWNNDKYEDSEQIGNEKKEQ